MVLRNENICVAINRSKDRFFEPDMGYIGSALDQLHDLLQDSPKVSCYRAQNCHDIHT